MKRCTFLLVLCLLLGACAPGIPVRYAPDGESGQAGAPARESAAPEAAPLWEDAPDGAGEEWEDFREDEDWDDWEDDDWDEEDWEDDWVDERLTPMAFHPGGLDAKDTIEAYLEQFYRSYVNLRYIDVSDIVDTSQVINDNMLQWQKALIQRRRLLDDYGLCYVETEKFPYRVVYISEGDLNDQRMSFWRQHGTIQEGETVIHFVIEGDGTKAYPPLLALNAQHTMRLKQIDGVWKITAHYFPGSVRKYMSGYYIKLQSDEEVLAQLRAEFAHAAQPDDIDIPAGAARYNAAEAVKYARTFMSSPNSNFYHVGDWMGNCANFMSQCVWYGFGSETMTADWYAGDGGGSPAWENVAQFWTNITQSGTLRGQVLGGVSAVQAGDIIQTRPKNARSVDGYNHSLLVMDTVTLLLSQNSPSCYVYYSDLVNVTTRFVRPVWLQA